MAYSILAPAQALFFPVTQNPRQMRRSRGTERSSYVPFG